jgi:IMP cyclohydrolase
LKTCEYPGRGIIIGATPDKQSVVQIYWIMGRSARSRNRVFEIDDNNYVKTRAFDPSKLENPDLIIYSPMKHYKNIHVVTNGDQTETIMEFLRQHKTFEQALNTREYEPDAPHYTPRISGILWVEANNTRYTLAILKTLDNQPGFCVRYFYNYTHPMPGIGHCITTYEGNGDPLPSFQGEPRAMPLYDDINDNLRVYWDALHQENKIALAVKMINLAAHRVAVEIKNKHED